MKYICEFKIPVINNEGRYYALSACDMASYIHSVLNKIGYSVEIISPSFAKKCSGCRIDRVSKNVLLISGFSLGWIGPITRCFSRFSAMLWLLCFLLFKCRANERIMIYHGVQNALIFVLARRIKHFKYILEVGELYSSLSGRKVINWRRYIEKIIIHVSDAYIFASKQLERRCNLKNKPFIIINGSYLILPRYNSKRNDSKIHIVFAGLIKNEKAAFICVKTALFFK